MPLKKVKGGSSSVSSAGSAVSAGSGATGSVPSGDGGSAVSAGSAGSFASGPSSDSESSSSSSSSSSSTHVKSYHSPNFQFLSLIGPYVLIGFFFLLSFFNTNLKGIVYLIGVIVLLFFSGLVDGMIPESKEAKAMCNLFGMPTLGKNLPFGLLVYGFTFAYLFFPMIQNSMMNYPLIVGLLLITGVDITIQLYSKCSTMNGVMISLALSLVFGFIWYLTIQSLSPSLLYHVDYLSDKQVCSMPSQQKFKCSVYKNGELISTTTK